MSQQNETAPIHSNLVLALLVVADFVVVLDFSIVQIALPTLREELGISIADLQWILSAYGLTFAGFLMLSGRASDFYGRRKLLIVGLVLFALSSLAAGLAPSELALIAARAVQGIGAAIASATSFALVIAIFAPIGKLNRAISVFIAVASAAFTAGIILGGVITQTLGWRSIFFVNVPIGFLGALVAPRLLPESKSGSAKMTLDVPGAVTVTVGLMLLVYGLSNAANTGLANLSTVLTLALSVAVLSGFVWIESRSNAPLVPLEFLRRGAVFNGNAVSLLTSAAMNGTLFMLVVYMQQTVGYSPLSAAFALVPASLIFFVMGGFLAARLVTRLGVRRVLIGAELVQTVGILLFTRISLSGNYTSEILPGLLIVSLGASLGFTGASIAAVSGARQGEEGLASGLVNTSGIVGGPIGLAIAVTLIGAAAGSGGVPSPSSLVAGYQVAYVGMTALSAFAIFMAFRIGTPQPGVQPPSELRPAVPEIPEGSGIIEATDAEDAAR